MGSLFVFEKRSSDAGSPRAREDQIDDKHEEALHRIEYAKDQSDDHAQRFVHVEREEEAEEPREAHVHETSGHYHRRLAIATCCVK